MGIRPMFDIKKVVGSMMEEPGKAIEEFIFRNFSIIGESARNLAVSKHTYVTRTGNLAASVGYLILKDGKEVFSGGFDPNANPEGGYGEQGAMEGRQHAREIAETYPNGYVLVMVTGMEYGEAVEKKGYDVLVFTKVEAKRLAQELMQGGIKFK